MSDTPPLDLDELQRLCDIPRPKPTYRTGSGNFTPEFDRDWERFAAARRDMANALPAVLAELRELRAALAAAQEHNQILTTAVCEVVAYIDDGNMRGGLVLGRIWQTLARAVSPAPGGGGDT